MSTFDKIERLYSGIDGVKNTSAVNEQCVNRATKPNIKPIKDSFTKSNPKATNGKFDIGRVASGFVKPIDNMIIKPIVGLFTKPLQTLGTYGLAIAASVGATYLATAGLVALGVSTAAASSLVLGTLLVGGLAYAGLKTGRHLVGAVKEGIKGNVDGAETHLMQAAEGTTEIALQLFGARHHAKNKEVFNTDWKTKNPLKLAKNVGKWSLKSVKGSYKQLKDDFLVSMAGVSSKNPGVVRKLGLNPDAYDDYLPKEPVTHTAKPDIDDYPTDKKDNRPKIDMSGERSLMTPESAHSQFIERKGSVRISNGENGLTGIKKGIKAKNTEWDSIHSGRELNVNSEKGEYGILKHYDSSKENPGSIKINRKNVKFARTRKAEATTDSGKELRHILEVYTEEKGKTVRYKLDFDSAESLDNFAFGQGNGSLGLNKEKFIMKEPTAINSQGKVVLVDETLNSTKHRPINAGKGLQYGRKSLYDLKNRGKGQTRLLDSTGKDYIARENVQGIAVYKNTENNKVKLSVLHKKGDANARTIIEVKDNEELKNLLFRDKDGFLFSKDNMDKQGFSSLLTEFPEQKATINFNHDHSLKSYKPGVLKDKENNYRSIDIDTDMYKQVKDGTIRVQDSDIKIKGNVKQIRTRELDDSYRVDLFVDSDTKNPMIKKTKRYSIDFENEEAANGFIQNKVGYDPSKLTQQVRRETQPSGKSIEINRSSDIFSLSKREMYGYKKPEGAGVISNGNGKNIEIDYDRIKGIQLQNLEDGKVRLKVVNKPDPVKQLQRSIRANTKGYVDMPDANVSAAEKAQYLDFDNINDLNKALKTEGLGIRRDALKKNDYKAKLQPKKPANGKDNDKVKTLPQNELNTEKRIKIVEEKLKNAKGEVEKARLKNKLDEYKERKIHEDRIKENQLKLKREKDKELRAELNKEIKADKEYLQQDKPLVEIDYLFSKYSKHKNKSIKDYGFDKDTVAKITAGVDQKDIKLGNIKAIRYQKIDDKNYLVLEKGNFPGTEKGLLLKMKFEDGKFDPEKVVKMAKDMNVNKEQLTNLAESLGVNLNKAIGSEQMSKAGFYSKVLMRTMPVIGDVYKTPEPIPEKNEMLCAAKADNELNKAVSCPTRMNTLNDYIFDPFALPYTL